MISPEYCRIMARYNVWQNTSLYGAADGLTDAERKQDRGAFFGSIHGTLSHLMWGDMMWMSRFDGGAKPDVAPQDHANITDDWSDLHARRVVTDRRISDWAAGVVQGDIEGDLVWYSGILKADMSKPRWILLAQMFNHQTHHRGQVHAMLTAAGAKPEATDLGFMPD